MRFRLHGGALHTHGCSEHKTRCDYFSDHTLAWMVGSRDAARAQLLVYRRSVVARISALTGTLASIDLLLGRLERIGHNLA